MILGLSLPYLWIRLMRNPVGWIIEYIWTTRHLLMLFLLWILCTVLALILVTTRSSKASTAYRKYFHALIVIVFTSGVFIDVSFLYLSSVVGLCVMVLLEHMRFKNIEPIASLLNSFFQVEKLLDTIPAPLKGAAFIQRLLFEPSDYHIKTNRIWLLAWFIRGATTNRERHLIARVRYF